MENKVKKYVTHSREVLNICCSYGWLPGARYTNLRDIRHFKKIGFIDIDWNQYDFKAHLDAVKKMQPQMTVACDITSISQVDSVLKQAKILSDYAEKVIIVPKTIKLASILDEVIPGEFVLGYSVPTKYGGTRIAPWRFRRPVHLLGGRPEAQRQLANLMPVFSIDCNRFTLDATFGDYFDGKMFRPHPSGGYRACIMDSVKNINKLWSNYVPIISTTIRTN